MQMTTAPKNMLPDVKTAPADQHIDYLQTTEPAPSPQDDTHASVLGTAPLSLLAAAALAACGGGGGASDSAPSSQSPAGTAPAPGPTPTPIPVTASSGFTYPKAMTDEEAARFLQQAQFSSTANEIAAARAGTYGAWLDQQFANPQSETGWNWLESRTYGDDANAKKNVYNESIADFMIWKQLLSAPDAMRKRVALALSEFFVVSFSSMEIDWRGYTMTAYWDLLNQNAFGNFRNLLEDITLNPAMGYFLNTRGNQKEDAASGRQPDENYAREIMQLFSIGLSELNLDGTEKLGANGKRIDTYGADDVSQLARVFTGYDVDKQYRGKLAGVFPTYSIDLREYARQRMTLDPNKHSNLAVSFLTANIPANAPAAQALKTALDTLFNHPNVGPFFGKQMIQRLVSSNPSPAYVARVAKVFNDNGTGIRGDLKSVWAAILLDDEARGPQALSSVGAGKVREPILRFVQWGRSFGLKSLQNSWKFPDQSNPSYGLGQSPMRSPSVFNFFRPGYVPANTAMANQGAPAPEFQLVNETTVGSYINYMGNVIEKGIKTFEPASPDVTYTTQTLDLVTDYSFEYALVNNTAFTDAAAAPVALALTQRMNSLLCAGQMSAATQTEIQNALKLGIIQRKIINTSVVDEKNRLVSAAILMTMASPDYLVQK